MNLWTPYCHNCLEPDHTARTCPWKTKTVIEPMEPTNLPCGCHYPFPGEGNRHHVERRIKYNGIFHRVVMCRNHNRKFYIYTTIKFAEITVTKKDVYIREGRIDPERLLARLGEQDSVSDG